MADVQRRLHPVLMASLTEGITTIRKGATLVIEPTANGWLVREQVAPNDLLCFSHVHVFQDMQYDQEGVTSERTLFGFLLAHFGTKAP